MPYPYIKLYEMAEDDVMQITLRRAIPDERDILFNLLEKYAYEFSQYDRRDVNQYGLYGYQYLDYYWDEECRFPYFIEADGKLAGFVLVNDYPEAPDRELDYAISEFFVMYKYRRMGAGTKAFELACDAHRGRWQLKMHPHNTASVKFWTKTVSEYTGGNYELVRAYPGTEYDDGTLGDVFFFDNGI